jgi:hypothetical protein
MPSKTFAQSEASRFHEDGPSRKAATKLEGAVSESSMFGEPAGRSQLA